MESISKFAILFRVHLTIVIFDIFVSGMYLYVLVQDNTNILKGTDGQPHNHFSDNPKSALYPCKIENYNCLRCLFTSLVRK